MEIDKLYQHCGTLIEYLDVYWVAGILVLGMMGGILFFKWVLSR